MCHIERFVRLCVHNTLFNNCCAASVLFGVTSHIERFVCAFAITLNLDLGAFYKFWVYFMLLLI